MLSSICMIKQHENKVLSMSNYNPWFQLSEHMQVDLQVGSCWNDLLPMPMCHEFGFLYIYINSAVKSLRSVACPGGFNR